MAGPWEDFQQPAAAAEAGPWSDFQQPSAPESPAASAPHTTAPGVAASAARGLAPYATGAAVGAGIGSIVPGVGTAAGAAAGAGAVALTDLTSSAARALGIEHMPTVQQGTDRVLDWFGVRRPTTGIERTAETTAAGVGGAVSGVGAAREIAGAATSPVVKGVASGLAERPVAQAVSGGLAGAAEQTAAESHVGPAGQQMAGFLGSALPFVKPRLGSLVRIDPKAAAKTAIDKGYVVPPIEAAEGGLAPYSVPSLLSAQSGKIKMGQYAATTNQPVTNRLAAEELGLAPDTLLTDAVFDRVRGDAGRAYADLPRAMPSITNDPQFLTEVSGIGAEARAAAEHFPDIVKVGEVNKVLENLLGAPERPTSAMMEAVKRLRFDAKANLKASADPDKLVLGLAQRRAAQAIDDLIERRLAETGDEDLSARYRAARTVIAKAHDIESVTNVSTGDVSARGLGRLLDKGKPLTGNLKIIGDSANHFPRAFQNPTAFGGVEPLSVLDSLAGAFALGRGNLGLAGTVLGRPIARSTVLSHPFQRAMVSQFQPPSVPFSVLQALGGQPNAAQDLGEPQ